MQSAILNTPTGELFCAIDDNDFWRISFCKLSAAGMTKAAKDRRLPLIKKQMNEYFKGHRRFFDIELPVSGTDFQKSVWSVLKKIPYGQTVTYQEIAGEIGNEKSVRAVGSACRVNPLPIIVPCHRVVLKNGGVGNYAGGRRFKEYLLSMERRK